MEASRRAAQQLVRSDDPAARAVAEQWFDAYAHGDVARMVRQAAVPFRSNEGVAARSSGELGKMFRELVSEASGKRSVHALQLYTAAGARKVLAGLPSGFSESAGQLFAVGHVGGDSFVLVLAPHGGHWRAIGLVRQ